MTYKLIAADMDGTLLNNNAEITPRTRDALHRVIEAGVLFVPSTGRPMAGMRQVLAAFDYDLPLILFNGALAVTAKSARTLFSKGLNYACAELIYAQGIRRGYPVVAWAGERLFVDCETEEITTYQRITGTVPVLTPDTRPMRPYGVTKILWILPPEDAARQQAEMRALLGSCVNCHTSQPHLLEFVDAGASKGLALAALGAAYGINQSEMIAIGDGFNDASMLEYAGLGVAMGNAPAAIKAMCQYIAPSNDEDGVAAVIERFIL